MTDENENTKTVALRFAEPLWSQFSALAALKGITATDAARDALREYIKAHKDEVAAQAKQVLRNIDYEAAMKKQAIVDLFDPKGKAI